MTRRLTQKSSVIALSGAVVCLALAACKPSYPNNPFDSLNGHNMATKTRARTAAADAVDENNITEALAQYEKLFEGRRYAGEDALKYAELLRRSGDADKALTVASKAAKLKNAPPALMNEVAAAKIALGDFAGGEDAAGQTLANPDLTGLHAESAHLMGIAVDAQGRHKDAEIFFRQALDKWQDDPAPVMNNLGLNLANQAKFDEALTILRQALLLSPDRAEIARNIDIVSELRDKVVPKAPTKIVY
jgi:Flp pilus assembly protein TadD